jgi:hypothetical protein
MSDDCGQHDERHCAGMNSRRVPLIRRVWMNSSSCRQSGWILLQVPQRWIIVAVLLDICWAIATLADKGPEQALMTSCRISCRRNAVLTYCWTRRQCLRFGRRRRGCISAVGCVSRRRPIRVISVISRRVAIIIRRTCCHRCGGSNHGSSAEQLPTHANLHVLEGDREANPLCPMCLRARRERDSYRAGMFG